MLRFTHILYIFTLEYSYGFCIFLLYNNISVIIANNIDIWTLNNMRLRIEPKAEFDSRKCYRIIEFVSERKLK